MKRLFQVFVLAMAVLAVTGLVAATAFAKGGQNGTTLAAYKTVDICVVDPTDENPYGTTWIYSGEIAVWNEGAVDTQGLAIKDCIQFKPLTGGGQFADVTALCQDLTVSEIPKGTTQLTAITFPYSIKGDPLLDGYIRNSAYLTITNHSGSLGTPKGPNPKATYDGTMPPPPCEGLEICPDGCTYGQGYWKSTPGVVWPDPYSRDDIFFLATKEVCTANCGGNPNDDVIEIQQATWQDVLDASVNLSQGYYQLAHQYIAAVLNVANMDDQTCVPQGVQDTLALAVPWLNSNAPSACTGAGSCGTQKDWASVLEDFNSGVYEGGPQSCGN